MGYKHPTYLQRCEVCALLRAGHTQTRIAQEIGVHKSTISRELKRNMVYVRTKLGSWQYKPDYAQFYAEERKKTKPRKVKFTTDIERFVREKILENWSPDQISGYAKRHDLFDVSHERIYRFILNDKQKGGSLYKRLRHQHKKYRKRYGSPKRQSPIKNRTMIDDRPTIVDEKSRLGDWEIDTIIGKNHKQAIVSIVERLSKKTFLRKVKSKTASLVSKSTIQALREVSDRVLTITADNGSEFAYHEKIASDLGLEFYFAHPYSSWERGLNENTNGLVRQYLEKGSDFSSVTDRDLMLIEEKLNTRPRKTLGYATPEELFSQCMSS